MSHYLVDHSVVAGAYATLHAEYTALVSLRQQIEADAAKVVPASVSPHMPGVQRAVDQTQKAATAILLNEVIAVETQLAAVLQGIYDAVNTYGRTDSDSATAMVAAAKKASAASATVLTAEQREELDRLRRGPRALFPI